MLQFLRPHQVVHEFTAHIEHRRRAHHNDKEDQAQGHRQHVQHRIHPNARIVLDDVQPDQVRGHEREQDLDPMAARWELTERREQLQHNEDHDVRVQDVVQPSAIMNRD